jgi:Tfp pilus assembly protein PilW
VNCLPTAARRHRQAAFTQPELLVASAIAIFVMSSFFVFSDFTGRSLAGIARQNLLNQRAGYAADYIVSRIRLATFVTNDATGNTLILAFDDNVSADSNNDGLFGNDRDHWELFQFQSGDGSDTSYADNKLIYRPNTNSTASTTLINGCLRKLPGLPFFSLTNNATVLLNYGMLDSGLGERAQTIEIRTQAVRRNRPD